MLPRLVQMLQDAPHTTNRYLNLLAFFTRIAPQEISAWRATLDQATAVITAARTLPVMELRPGLKDVRRPAEPQRR